MLYERGLSLAGEPLWFSSACSGTHGDKHYSCCVWIRGAWPDSGMFELVPKHLFCLAVFCSMNTKWRKYLSDRSCFVSLLTWKERKGFSEMRCWSPATLPGFMCLFGTEVKRRINPFISAITMEWQEMSKAQDRRSEQGVDLATICVFLFLFSNVGKTYGDEKPGSFSVTTWIQRIYGLIDGAHES